MEEVNSPVNIIQCFPAFLCRIQSVKTKIEQCSKTAEDFTKLYYNSIDKKRHQLGKLYLDAALLVWNGIGVTNKDAIQKYILELPASEHNLQVLDAQPVVDDAVSGQLTFLILTAGTVKYYDSAMRYFQQSFVIVAHGDKWKIASDCYRLQDSLATAKID